MRGMAGGGLGIQPDDLTMSNKRLNIVGGVAGGANAAARARRLCEDCEIIMFERGPHVSFANCGLPYFVGGEIAEQDSLLVQTPELGVKPETRLASEAGLEIGKLGGIRVNENLQTSDPHIWAVGDAIEVRDGVTGQWAFIPLAGPANRQGRIAADNILGRPSRYEHTWGTAILRLFKLTAACTGANEETLRRAAIPFQAIHLHPSSHAGYYPGAEPIALKVLFAPGTGKLLGAQAIGHDGVDKRIDVLATALKTGMTVHDLAELELAYAPPYGSAKDPVNLAGMAAQNVLAGDVALAQWNEVASFDPSTTLLLDVRRADERAAGFIPGSTHIPLDELRQRLSELPRDREIIAYRQSGQCSYNAARILSQHGFRVRNLTGAYRTWRATQSQ